MSGTQVFNRVEITAACSAQVPPGDVLATRPFLFLTKRSRHSTRPSNTVVVWVDVGVVVTVVVVVELTVVVVLVIEVVVVDTVVVVELPVIDVVVVETLVVVLVKLVVVEDTLVVVVVMLVVVLVALVVVVVMLVVVEDTVVVLVVVETVVVTSQVSNVPPPKYFSIIRFNASTPLAQSGVATLSTAPAHPTVTAEPLLECWLYSVDAADRMAATSSHSSCVSPITKSSSTAKAFSHTTFAMRAGEPAFEHTEQSDGELQHSSTRDDPKIDSQWSPLGSPHAVSAPSM